MEWVRERTSSVELDGSASDAVCARSLTDDARAPDDDFAVATQRDARFATLQRHFGARIEGHRFALDHDIGPFGRMDNSQDNRKIGATGFKRQHRLAAYVAEMKRYARARVESN